MESRVRASETSDVTNPDDLTRPDRCPVCRSRELTTTSKTISLSTYWRCLACGEVWNDARRREGSGALSSARGRWHTGRD
jgi:hypothetical protein